MVDSKQSAQDAAEFVRLLTGFQRRLYLYILTLVSDTADAEEILQESNVAIWSKSDQFTLGSNFAAWAYRIAYFEVLAFRKRAKRDRLEFSPELLDLLASERAEAPELQPPHRHGALAACLERLSPADRDLIARRYMPGASVAEVAESLNRPVKSIYRSLERVRSALLECVKRSLAREAGE